MGDTIATVRDAAIDYLSANYNDKDLLSVYTFALNDSSYAVLGSAIIAITKMDSAQGVLIAKKYENEKNKDVLMTIAEVYVKYGNAENHEFFEKSVNKIKGYPKAGFIKQYGAYLKNINDDKILNTALDIMKQVAEKDKTNKGATSAAKKVIQELEPRISKE